MSQVLKFPSLRASSGHMLVSIRVRDKRHPERYRWHAQWAILNAAGGRALKGFTNDAAIKGAWHTFEMRRRYRQIFEDEIEALVRNGRIDVEINGRRLSFSTTRSA